MFETALLGAAIMTETDLPSSFMEGVSTASTVQDAKDETVESAQGTDPKDVERKPEA